MIIGEVVELSREGSGPTFLAILRGGHQFCCYHWVGHENFWLPLNEGGGGHENSLDTSDGGRHLFVFFEENIQHTSPST